MYPENGEQVDSWTRRRVDLRETIVRPYVQLLVEEVAFVLLFENADLHPSAIGERTGEEEVDSGG